MENQPHITTKPDNSGPARGVKRGLIAVAALAAIVAVYGGYWNYMAGQVRAGIEQWAAERRAEGYGAEYAAITVSGFPFRLDVEISAPALTAPDQTRPWSWRGPGLIIEARPWAWDRARVLAPGRHRITAPGRGKPGTFVLDAGALTVTLGFNRGPAAFAMVVDAADIVYPKEPLAGLGRTTKRLTLAVAVEGDLPKTLNADAMARWRDRGGTLEVSRFTVRHGPLGLTGDGTGALDADMQPIGAFTLFVRGFNEALDRLEGAGVIKPKPAGLVKTVLGIMARGGDGETGVKADTGTGPDSNPRLKVPLSVQDGKLYIGPVAVAEMPPVRWPPSR